MRNLLPTLLLSLGLLVPTSSSAQEWPLAKAGTEYSFPRDHGEHPDYRTEWWYVTGNAESSEGREYGFQFTLFRNRLRPPCETGVVDSPLSANQLYLGHFALSDIGNRRHYHSERLGRPGLGQARASEEGLDIAIGGWTMTMDEEGSMRLRAGDDSAGVDLVMRPVKPIVLHGDGGVHMKTNDPDQASNYLSFTRLETSGTVTVGESSVVVEGLSWMDHEWGSSWLGADEAGWDWFALQLDNGVDVMLYQIRQVDGTPNPEATGTVVYADGSYRSLPSSEYSIQPTGEWRSPSTGVTYPMGWVLAIESENATLDVSPAFESQEMDVSRTTGGAYWEGAIRAEGTWGEEHVRGSGYSELVGYGGRQEGLTGD